MRIVLKDKYALRKHIIKAGFTNKEFANLIGFTFPHTNNVISGARQPSPRMAKVISETLGIKFDDIFFIEDDVKISQ